MRCCNSVFRNILLLLLFFSHAAHACKLQPSYSFDTPLVTSKTIDPDCAGDFTIVRIPEDKTVYRMDTRVIAKTFELHGVPLETSNIRYVNFMKRSPVDMTPFKEQLSQLLHASYDTIQIHHITIVPRGYIESLPQGAVAVFDKRTQLSANGTFYVLDKDGLRRYLDYSVDATVPVLHTSQKVSRKQELGPMNCELRPIALSTFKDTPLIRFPSQGYRFRSSYREGHLLTVRNVEAIPLVLKNEKVVVTIQNGSVVIEFGAVATQEGSLYDIITIQKRDGKRAKAKVIGENRVELQ